jgi:hypothetical protein
MGLDRRSVCLYTGSVIRVPVVLLLLALPGCEDGPATVTITAEPEAPAAAAPEVDAETVEQLQALGYLPTAPTRNPDERGVTNRSSERESAGLNVFCSRRRASATLVDMDGQVLHRWTAADGEPGSFMHVEPLPGGELLVIVRDRHIEKRAWDSNVIWRRRIRAHHDVAVREDGRLFVLVRNRAEVEHGGVGVPVLADAVAVLSPDGEVERTAALLPLLRHEVSARRLGRVQARVRDGEPLSALLHDGGIGDVLHANSIAFLHREIPGIAPAGSVLISFRAISRIALLDATLTRLLWTWGEDELDGQHDATQLDNGNLLIFDNGLHRGTSRVIELDAAAGRIVWTYASPALFSRIRGGAQGLPNGNVLITESERGHAIEVTRRGEKVWEFWNPDVRHVDGEVVRGVVYRLNRFPASHFPL